MRNANSNPKLEAHACRAAKAPKRLYLVLAMNRNVTTIQCKCNTKSSHHRHHSHPHQSQQCSTMQQRWETFARRVALRVCCTTKAKPNSKLAFGTCRQKKTRLRFVAVARIRHCHSRFNGQDAMRFARIRIMILTNDQHHHHPRQGSNCKGIALSEKPKPSPSQLKSA